MEKLYKKIIKGEEILNNKFKNYYFSKDEQDIILSKNFNLLLLSTFVNKQKFIDYINIEIFELNKIKQENIIKKSLFLEKRIIKLEYLNILKDLFYKYNK